MARGHKPLLLGSPHFSDQESTKRNLAEYYEAFHIRTRR